VAASNGILGAERSFLFTPQFTQGFPGRRSIPLLSASRTAGLGMTRQVTSPDRPERHQTNAER